MPPSALNSIRPAAGTGIGAIEIFSGVREILSMPQPILGRFAPVADPTVRLVISTLSNKPASIYQTLIVVSATDARHPVQLFSALAGQFEKLLLGGMFTKSTRASLLNVWAFRGGRWPAGFLIPYSFADFDDQKLSTVEKNICMARAHNGLIFNSVMRFPSRARTSKRKP